jgi:DNA-directed RNA polymerase subunit RPC12/RpoP
MKHNATNERINFRLIQTPCCGTLLCWINPRLPSHCPECGKTILMRLRQEGEHILVNREGWLKLEAVQ